MIILLILVSIIAAFSIVVNVLLIKGSLRFGISKIAYRKGKVDAFSDILAEINRVSGQNVNK